MRGDENISEDQVPGQWLRIVHIKSEFAKHDIPGDVWK